jgi:hypothetical protein
MTGPRISTKQSAFDGYIVSVDDYLSEIIPGGTISRGESLGMTALEVSTTNQFRLKWRSGDPMNPGAYELHSNPDIKSKGTHAKVIKLMKDFSVFLRPILVRISVHPNLTPDDRLVLHIAEPVTTHHHPTASITEQCNATGKALGGGQVKLDFRYSTDKSLPSKPKGADALEIAYRISPKYFEKQGTELSTKTRIAMIDPGEAAEKMISTKASFILKLGTLNADMELQFFVRWINTKHRDLDGPYTGPFYVTIL